MQKTTSRALNRRGIANLSLFRTLLGICQKSQEPGSFKKASAMVTSLTELYYKFRRMFCWYKQKSDFYELLLQYKELKSLGNEWWLTWCLWCGIYTSIPTWTHSQNSSAAAEAPSLKISSYATSLGASQSAQE